MFNILNYYNSNMTQHLWFFCVLNTSGNCKTMELWTLIFAILSLKPWSYVRILIYRTWAIGQHASCISIWNSGARVCLHLLQ